MATDDEYKPQASDEAANDEGPFTIPLAGDERPQTFRDKLRQYEQKSREVNGHMRFANNGRVEMPASPELDDDKPDNEFSQLNSLQGHPLIKDKPYFDGAADPNTAPPNPDNQEAYRHNQELRLKMQQRLQNQLGAKKGFNPTPTR